MPLMDVDLEQLLGADAAEDETDERLRSYFLETAAYREVTNPDRRLRVVVGSKGTGKSAIFMIAMFEDREARRLPIEVRPDDLSDVAQGTLNYLQLVSAWKKGLAGVIIEKSLRALGDADEKFLGKAKKATGHILDAIVKSLGDEQKGYKLDAARIDAAKAFMTNRELTLYIDDLDRGWTGKQQDARRYGAMFDAIRDLQRDNPTLRVRVGLRTDLYTLIRSSDSASNKWQAAVVHHTWTNHQTFVLLVKRIVTYFGGEQDYDRLLELPQGSLAHLLDPILERYPFSSRSGWSVRRRPVGLGWAGRGAGRCGRR